MLRKAPANLPADLKSVVDYRKSGLSLNHVVGCPLNCGYCVRHLFDNFEMKQPHRVLPTEQAVNALITNWAFKRHITPIQIFNRATDPFLPKVKDELFATLEMLDKLRLRNTVLVITRWHILPLDIQRLESLKNIRLTILVTWSGIEDKRLEPVDSAVAEQTLVTLSQYANRTKSILYWRPLIVGVNDTLELMEKAAKLARLSDATVFTGLFLRKEIRDYLASCGVLNLYDQVARRKILPKEIETKVLKVFDSWPIFRKTSCAIAYAHSISDYNGHFGIQDICDICPKEQYERCKKAHARPREAKVFTLATQAGLDPASLLIEANRIQVEGSREQQRYYLQHNLNFQVHDKAHPHKPKQHGRAEIGWES